MPRKFIIGRERESDIAIADDSVSRKHAEIWLEDNGTIMLADRGSSNGTQLIRGGVAAPMTTSALLPGDHVRFGAVSLSLQELVDAIELKHPGALTPARPSPPSQPPPLQAPAPAPPPPIPAQFPTPQHAGPPPMPPPIPAGANAGPVPPPVPRATPPAIPPGLPPVPPAIPPAAPPALHAVPPPPPLPPAIPQAAPYRAPGAALVRCECGAIKTHGEPCPTCHR